MRAETVDTEDITGPDQWHTLLHRLWSKAVGAPDYVKAEWIELESILHGAAVKLVLRPNKDRAEG